MDTYLAIASRRDQRRYLPEPLPAAVVQRILDAGRLAGSSKNRQPWTFVIPESRERVEAIADAVYVPENVLAAGLVVGILITEKGPTVFDAARAAQNMLLCAWNEGVASCPNGVRDPEAAATALAAQAAERPVIVLTFGVPERTRDPEAHSAEEWSARANRKPLDAVVRHVF